MRGPLECLALVRGVSGMKPSAEKLSAFRLGLSYISGPQLSCMPETRCGKLNKEISGLTKTQRRNA